MNKLPLPPDDLTLLDKSGTVSHAPQAHWYRDTLGWALLAMAVPLLWKAAYPLGPVGVIAGFLFWHTAVEVFAVVVALLIFSTGYRALSPARNGAAVLLGVAFLGVGLLDFLHALSFTGLPDAITANSPQKSMFFWLAARLLAASALLGYVLLPTVPGVTLLKKRSALILVLAGVGALGYLGLYKPAQVPALFIPEQGLTSIKIGMEWLIVGINCVTLVTLWRRRKALEPENVVALAFAVGLSAVSDVFFTMLGVVDTDVANGLGHVYKVAAYLYLYKAIIQESLMSPLAKMAAQNLRESLTLNASPDGIFWVDETGHILMANRAMAALTGYSQAELAGQNVDIFLPEHLRAGHAQAMATYFTDADTRARGVRGLELMRRDGQMVPVDISLGSWDFEGTSYAIAYVRDVTERKKFEASLQHRATHDELTGLPTRWLFSLQVNQALASAGRSGQKVAVMCLDLDYFKNVNDSFGHAAGDTLLVQVGERIRGVLRENDALARLGGDEFAILLTELTDGGEAVKVAEKLLASIQSPYRLQDQEVCSGGSLGLAIYPDDAQDSDTLLRYADMAMYRAKHAERGAYACFSQAMDRRVHEDMQMHARLKDAIARGALELHYQPQVDVRSGAVVGAEALLRWHDSILGDVPPSRFIRVAEVTGLILPLSDWVLQAACEQIVAWTKAETPLHVAVNFSAQQFRQRNLPDKVSEALARTGAQAKWLGVEVTESVAMAQPEQAREQLEALATLGCSVALDDFGTGYSSLAYLKALPVSQLKVDKSFMDGIPNDADDCSISRAIIALAHSLGMTLVAEGVETEAQLLFLRQNGCEAYQGWLFAKAMTAAQMTTLISVGQA